MSYGFGCWKTIKRARSTPVCDECGHRIQIGEEYRRFAGKHDGDFYAYAAHGECVDWANAVMHCEPYEGRPPLNDSDPGEYALPEKILANPPSPSMWARLNFSWRELVEGLS